ncbi:methyl-accepting chemotaxis protein [Anaerocolumna jejuensis DSM 15929]|uniref:Methyl-accepting chemotaxis protein n=1 Tax=Anaerocolumna jejuensis DSM 15929 TaxID=1121322 RepID=A0A1M6X0M7_9FIRM|nr:cache domain-containing protein [Anaerocolumna jejuensis]SHK99473.1 methyl-accepting chemotaxis protein [Anaerocolumna jejuensis DSM 15929]
MKKSIKKNMMLKDKLLKNVRAILISTIIALFLLAGIALQLSYDTAITEKKQSFDIEIKTATDSLISALTANYQRYEAGDITKEEALSSSEKIVRDSRYNNGNGYFWADMADGLCVVHMNPEYEGTNRLDAVDKKGNYYIRNLMKAADKGTNFTEFYFTKPNTSGIFQKRAYTAKFEPYNWYISTGNYYDDINKSILTLRAKQTTSDIILILASLLCLLIGTRQLKKVIDKITQPLTTVTSRLHLLSQGDVHTPGSENITETDETGILAEAENSLIKQLQMIVEDISVNLQKISSGDLRIHTAKDYSGDFVPIQKSIKNITAYLNTVLLSINQASNQVKSGAEQVADTSRTLAEGATEQAGVIEELSASLDEISSHVEKNTTSVDKASDYTRLIIDKANEGNEKMRNLLTAMENIDRTSQEISGINKAIGAIAARTNLLALNAAIESARLGNEGKGFAVVAEEMRELAAQSASAVSETENLINTSLEAVANGSKNTAETANELKDITDMIKRFTDIMKEIDSESRQQNNELKQITQGIGQISAIIQNNVSAAEECSAFSEDLNTQAVLLFENVDKFKLSGSK